MAQWAGAWEIHIRHAIRNQRHPMPMKRIPPILLLALAGGMANATLLFTESMDFGGTSELWRDNDAATDVYNTTSARHRYEAIGLTHGQMKDVGGGMYTYNFTGGENTLGANTTTGAFDPDFNGIADAGQTYWLAALLRSGGGTSSLSLRLNNASSVNTLGFNLNSDGSISIAGSNDGGAATTQATGASATPGTTHLLLLRGTVGNTEDVNGPLNSVLDFWFDPADVFALGSPTYSTGPDSKFGRQNFLYTSVSIGGGSGSTDNVPALDEIRFATELTDIFAIPEPSSFLRVGLSGLVLFLRGCRTRQGQATRGMSKGD